MLFNSIRRKVLRGIHILAIGSMALPSWAQYQVNGSASQTSCNCYELTPDVANAGGSVWNVNQIDLNNPFDFNFEVWLGCDDWGADGIGFVLQPVTVNQGGSASSLGFGGISPSLVVEIDIWPNDVTMNDPPEDHIAILQNGQTDHASPDNLAGPVTASSTQNNIEDCQWHDVRIVWNPTLNSLTVYFDGVFRTSYTGNIIADIFNNNSMVYWGWTGGTGGASADQAFCNAIQPDFNVLGTTACAGTPIQFEDASVTSTGNVTSYDWDFDDGFTASGSPVAHTFAAAGNYDVELTITSEGCTESTIIPVTIDPAPVVDLGPDLNICTGETAQLNSPNTLGSGTYVWSPITALSNSSAPSPTTSTISTITYTLTYTSSNGCSDSDDITVNVSNGPTAEAGPDVTICQGDQVQLSASGGTDYSWSPASGLSDPLIADPVASPATTTTYTVSVVDGNSCAATDQVTVTVVPAPTVDAGTDQNVCAGDQVQLSASGTGSFVWSPAAGLSNPNSATPTAQPGTTTTYHVTLTDANGCSAVDSVLINVEPIPVADFDDPTAACEGSPVQFTDNSTGNIVNYAWDFGDGQFGNGPNPLHTYPAIGTYNVTLTVTSANGCTATTTGVAQVVDGPLPDFSIVNGPDLCVGERLEIVDNSTGPILGYQWDFGDGSVVSDPVPSYAYSAEGVYAVTLVLTAPDQCSSFQTMNVQVHPVPQVEFAATSGCEGQSTQFTDQSSVSTGVLTGWEWDFGDDSPIGYGNSPEHTYTQPGSYNVRLIAQTDAGCRDTMERAVTVNPSPEVAIAANDACMGSSVQFTNGSTLSSGTLQQWSWQFGDGSSDTSFEPEHSYGAIGTYQVQLTATTDSGCTATGTLQVEIFPLPQSEFSLSAHEGCAPVEVSFINESSIPSGYAITAYQWDFGDGTTTSESAPTHIYTQSGNFDVQLVAISQNGCTDTLSYSSLISVALTPVASFHFTPTDATMLDPRIRFVNTSANATSYVWDLGDGQISTETDPVNEYAVEGDFLVTLVASNGQCSSSVAEQIHIDPETVIYIPNSFTPNGDGLNDHFIPKGIGIRKFSMAIYDRWGKELYFTRSMDSPWNGWYMGAELPNGTYVYRIDILDVLGEVRTYCGSVTLVR